MSAPVLEVEGLVKHFPILGGLLQRRVGEVRAVDGVSFAIAKGETLGLVGESGCGKSTIGKTVLKLIEPTAGRILLERRGRHQAQARRHVAAPPAHPDDLPGSVLVDEPAPVGRDHRRRAARELRHHARCRDTTSASRALFERVGLRPDAMRKYAHEFSGGQRQRLGIAKALSVNPELIVADEPVSALDVSVQAQVLNLLIDLQEEYRARLPLHQPRPRRDAPYQPSHRGDVSRPHRRAHDQAHAVHPARCTPTPRRCCRRRRRPIPSGGASASGIVQGDVPSPANPPPGCHFHTRCPYAMAECKVTAPPRSRWRPATTSPACVARSVAIQARSPFRASFHGIRTARVPRAHERARRARSRRA